MKTLFLLGLLTLITHTTAGRVKLAAKAPLPTPAPTHDQGCPDCYEAAGNDTHLELGACCFGHTCLASGVPQHRCRGIWAGADTACEDCERIRPCCNTFTGECTHEFCSDCFESHGTPVEACELCEAVPTPAPSPTPETKATPPPATTAAPPATTTKHGPPDGACCVPDGTCAEMTQKECHECEGVFRGDYTECGEDICKRQCCEGTLTCSIVDKISDCAGRIGPFGTECPDEPETCGVSCCVKEKCVIADSAEDCEACNGRPFEDAECEDVDCGGACCAGSTCSFQESEDDCLQQDVCIALDNCEYKSGENCATEGICGGACCDESAGCTEGSELACAGASGVYQGNQTICGGQAMDEICLNDGACCIDGQCVPKADAVTCFKHGGVWQGEGSSCDDDDVKCGAGACCTGKGCLVAMTERECAWKGGKFRGQGTNCDLPAICDSEGGACCCEDKCIDMASEKKCRAFGGRSWQGVGSSCMTDGICEEPGDEAGACCIQKSYIADGALCSITQSEAECLFKGGSFSGAGSTCGDQGDGEFQCKVVRGACCVSGEEKCFDQMTVSECRECGGHFAGADVSCSDDYVCEPEHTGACCKAGWPCKETTHVMCLREGGRFQGFETTCNDEDGKICSICLPTVVDRPNTNDCAHDSDCPDESICLKQYGLCAVAAYRIPSQYGKPHDWLPKDGWQPPAEDPWWTTENGVKFAALQTATTGAPAPSTTTGASGTPAPTPAPWADEPMNVGPLSCGSNATIGLPCVAHPQKGKCGIGICMPPPEGHTLSDDCVSMCRMLREYQCGCEAEDAWLASCASVAGHIYNDTNANGENDGAEGGVVGATVQLFRKEDGHYVFVSEEVTKEGGHYAFGGIPAGMYKVHVALPNGLGFGGDGKAYRKVTVECLEDLDGDGKLKKRGLQPTQITIQRKFKASHLAEDVDFFAVPGSDNTNGSGEDDDDSEMPGEGSGSHEGLSGAAIGGIVVGSLLCVVCIFAAVLLLCAGPTARRRSRRAMNSGKHYPGHHNGNMKKRRGKSGRYM